VDYAKLRTMSQGGQPVWDVADIMIKFLYIAAKRMPSDLITESAMLKGVAGRAISDS